MRRLVILSCLVSAVSLMPVGLRAQPTAKPAETKIKVVGVSVIEDFPRKNKEGITVHTGGSGTGIYFHATNHTSTFLSLDEGASKVQSMTDDKGANIFKKGNFSGVQAVSPSVITNDGHTIHFRVGSAAIPTHGATSIHVKATVATDVGTNKTEQTAKAVSLTKGTAVKLGTIAATITQARKPAWANEKDKLEVTFRASESFESIASIEFLGADGKEIKSKQSGSSSFGHTYEVTYNLEAVAKTVDIKVDYFAKVEEVDLPVDAKVTVGL